MFACRSNLRAVCFLSVAHAVGTPVGWYPVVADVKPTDGERHRAASGRRGIYVLPLHFFGGHCVNRSILLLVACSIKKVWIVLLMALKASSKRFAECAQRE